MRKPRNFSIRFSLEDDFFKVISRKSSDLNSISYRVFPWSVDFSEDVEPVMALVWINLSGLVPNFY